MKTPFFEPAFDRQAVTEAPLDGAAVEALHELFESPRLHEEIEAGNVTLAMIRPGLEASTNLSGTDAEDAFEIESHIAGLGVLAKFSLRFDQEAVDQFYGGQPRDVQLAKVPERHMVFANRWEEFSHIMLSGPTTVLLLHSPDGDAVQRWREQVGHWNIVDNHDPATLRGHFGTDNYNNLLHGSDSPEAVNRELGIIDSCLGRECEVSL